MAKILVVEDEPGIALGLEDSLRLEGHEVEMLGDGITGGCRASQEDFDLILLDIMLPRRTVSKFAANCGARGIERLSFS